MAKQATTSSEPKSGLSERTTRAQSSRTLQGPSERRRTRASSGLEEQGSKAPSTRISGPSAVEQPVPIPSPRKRWFLAYVEIPPYPRTARPAPGRPTLEKTRHLKRDKKGRFARPARGASSPPLKRLRKSKRGRVDRSPSVEEAQETTSKVGGPFDWWDESSLSPLTDIGSRPPSPMEGLLESGAGLESEGEELEVSRSVAPRATVDGTAIGEDLQVNPPINDLTQHPKDTLDKGEISSLSSVPTEEGYLSDDQCPTEAQRGSPICEGLEGEPSSSPALTSINSPELITEPLVPPRLEVTPVDEVAFARTVIEKTSQAATKSNTNLSFGGTAVDEVCQDISSLPDQPTHSIHPAPPPLPPAPSQVYGQTSANPILGDNGLYSAIPETIMTSGCEFGGYSTPDPSSGWATPFPLHPCDTGTSDHTRIRRLMSMSPDHQNPYSMEPSAPPTDAYRFFGPSDPPPSHYTSQPILFSTPHEFGRTQPLMTASQPTPEYVSSITPHFTPPPPCIAFAPVIPHDWLPSQPPPHPAALPEIAARVMLQQEEPPTRSPSPPPQNPQPMTTRGRGKGKYARKTTKTEHYEFSSFSYYPLGQPPPSSSGSMTSSSTTILPEPILQPEPLILPSNPPPTARLYPQDPQIPSMNVEVANVQTSVPVFSSFVNLTPGSFVEPGEEAQPFTSSSKYRPTGVRWM